jgi:DNA-binding PadR family transcriptional regulator
MNATAASLLGLLDTSGGELGGGELVRLARQRIGDFWSLTRSQVYRELTALEAQGYVTAGTPGPRDSRPVRVTAAGRKAYRNWLTEDLPGETIRIPLLLALSFGAVLPPKRLAAVFAQFEAEHRNRLDSYLALDAELAANDVDPYTRATLSFGVHYEEAVQRWLASLPPEVRPEPVTSGRRRSPAAPPPPPRRRRPDPPAR